MKTEYEVVFSSINIENIIKKIELLWWKCTRPIALSKRIIFDTPNGENTYLRVRDEWDGKITTTYKEIWNWKLDINSVKELETNVWDFEEMVRIYKKLWLKQKSFQEMYREIWEINWEIEFMIDKWPWLKPYIEIEWKNEEIVKKYSNKLWFDYSSWIFGSSFVIYEKEPWIPFDEMNSLKEITFKNPPEKYII